MIFSGPLFSPPPFPSPPLALFYHWMFLWHAEKQQGSLARNPSCGSMGRCQGMQFTSTCVCFRLILAGNFSTGIFFFLSFICVLYVYRLMVIVFAMRKLFLLFTYFLLVLSLCYVWMYLPISFSSGQAAINFRCSNPLATVVQCFCYVLVIGMLQPCLCLLLCLVSLSLRCIICCLVWFLHHHTASPLLQSRSP